ERGDLVAADRERRAERETVPFDAGDVGHAERQADVRPPDAHRQAAVETIALQLTQLGSDPEPRPADVAGPALRGQLEAFRDRPRVIEPDAAGETGDVRNLGDAAQECQLRFVDLALVPGEPAVEAQVERGLHAREERCRPDASVAYVGRAR